MSQILKHLQQRRGIDWFTSEGASHNRHLGRSRLAEYRIITWATPPRLAAKRGLMGTRLNEATSVLVLSIPIIVPRNVRMELNSPGDWIARRSSWSYSVLLPDRVFVQHPASSNCVFHGLDSKSLSDYLGFCEWQDTCLCLAVVSLTRLVYMSFVMTCWLRRVLCTILAWHAFSFLNLLPPHGAIAQDKPASDGPDKHRDTQRSARIAGCWLDPEVVEGAFPEQSAVTHAIERDTPAQAQFFHPCNPVGVPRHPQHDVLGHRLDGRCQVLVALGDGLRRMAGRAAEQLVKPGRGHGQARTIIEVGHVQAERAVGFQVQQLQECAAMY